MSHARRRRWHGSAVTEQIQIVIPLFPRVTALDAIGPYEVLQRIPQIDVVFAAVAPGEVRTESGMLGLIADAALAEVPQPSVIVFPGGIGTRQLLGNGQILDWLQTAHATSRLTTSVCTGSLVLAAAGLLNGLTAATHWSAYDHLEQLGARPVPERVVEHLERRIVTAAGVSSGIDMALRLVELLADTVAAQAAQLLIEYDPRPPFACGSPVAAPDAVLRRAAEYTAARK